MKLTKYGTPQWVGGSAVLLALAGLCIWLGIAVGWAFWPLAGLLLVVWGWVIAFFRDPERTPPDGAGLFVSAADGRVTDITPIGEESLLGREGVKVGVFMSIFDVHVNRAPCDATVEQIEHRKGIYLDARDPASSEKNESTTILLTVEHDGQRYPVVLRQIAGFVARRIVTDLQQGRSMRRGERIGMIKFGSRCELLVPSELAGEVRVEPGQHVTAGETVLVAAPIASEVP